MRKKWRNSTQDDWRVAPAPPNGGRGGPTPPTPPPPATITIPPREKGLIRNCLAPNFQNAKRIVRRPMAHITRGSSMINLLLAKRTGYFCECPPPNAHRGAVGSWITAIVVI